MSKVKLNVTGMSCAACSAHVEKALGKTEGVQAGNRQSDDQLGRR